MKSTRCARAFAFGLMIALTAALAAGQASAPVSAPASGPTAASAPSPTSGPSAAYLQVLRDRMAQLEQTPELAPVVRDKALDYYKQALAKLQSAATWANSARWNAKRAAEAPGKLAAIQAKQDPPPPAVDADCTLAELQARLKQATADLAAAGKTMEDIQVEPKRRAERRVELSKAQAAAKERLDQANAGLSEAAPADEGPEVSAARVVYLRACKTAASGELEAYAREVERMDAEADLLAAQRDDAARTFERLKGLTAKLGDAVNRGRQQEAQWQVERIREEFADAPAGLRKQVEELASLAQRRGGDAGLVAKIEQAAAYQRQARADLARIQAQRGKLDELVGKRGMTSSVCTLMRKLRGELEEPRARRERIARRQGQISEIQLDLIDLQEQRDALADVNAQADKLVAVLSPPAPQDETAQARSDAVRLLTAKRDVLDALIRDSNTCFNLLVELDADDRALAEASCALGRYLDERILWTPSAKPIGIDDLRPASDAVLYLVSPANWRAAAGTAWGRLWGLSLPIAGGLVAAVLCLAFRRRVLARVRRIADGVRDGSADRFVRTLESLLWAAVLAAPLPLLLLLGSIVFDSPERFQAGLSRGLLNIFLTLAVFQFLRQVCRPHGLGEAHFGWLPAGLQTARRGMQFLMLAVALTMFVYPLLAAAGNESWRNSLGRMVQIMQFAAMAVFAHLVLRPRGPVVSAASRLGFLHRFRHVWYALGLSGPLAAIALSWAGYAVTAGVLSHRLVSTFLLLALAGIVLALARRAIRCAAASAASRTTGVPSVVAAMEPLPIHLLTSDHVGGKNAGSLQPPGGQTGQTPVIQRERIDHLLRFVTALAVVLIVWLVWSPIIPALRMLRNIHVWGAVSLADAGLAVLVLFLTVAMVRNLPALVEAVLLRRLPMDGGARYAARAVLRYVIGFVGAVTSLGLVGLEWSKIQWLAAAMTVGLGFGLQEIFANFVSGLIILFERPIRLGDTITVGDITGTVTRMHIRSTTVTDWSCRELIVPNKDFITGRVINWTLSDRLVRLALPVPLPVTTDLKQAERVLLEAAGRHPLVLKVPAPSVILVSLEPAVLRFELRVYVRGESSAHADPAAAADLLQRQSDQVRHELNMAIEKSMRDSAKIV